ncbi:hypothetical protein SD81_028115 [Tolypothrix campylonemoides VB511288]|nr:hypothetical protein SD81_025195 [Tolypothrix campylonemoides VB511288]KAB8316980.1 hypothetical protein SD81_028115 [Tolypothrix campylonemoides VB511288]
MKRQCKVFAVPEPLQSKWTGLKTFVVIQRSGQRDSAKRTLLGGDRQSFHECQFYICSQCLEAEQLLAEPCGHWGIENRLHWGGSAVGGFPDLRRLPFKDVTFCEDFPSRRGGNAPVNWALLHTFFITSARFLGFRTIPQAQRALANQLGRVFSLLV